MNYEIRNETKTVLSEYIKYKIKVFRQLGIPLTEEQKIHMNHLKSDIAIDNYCLDIILAS